METKIHGTTLPVLEVTLQDGEKLVAEGGELSWMSPNINLHTTSGALGQSGVFGAIKRAASGSSIFLTEYTAQGGVGQVAFATKLPGSILPINVIPDGFLVQRHGFLCATGDVELSLGFQRKLGAGLFGGDGFRLQKVTGTGQFFVELSGEVVRKDLAQGEQLLVHPGHIGLFPATMPFEITTVPGIGNKIFGGDGLFLVRLSGPGTVLLQSLTIVKLAAEIQEYMPSGR
ncbi:MAG TPA: AIM24 family protein [Candidatus Dormibacteraeota bacterium]|nr:AIM24 family protein [Candidatus Dormibacteraeota bacterium]HVC23720.1 AIM24 family protein [Candidatus Dormibacteraeota bacterium]